MKHICTILLGLTLLGVAPGVYNQTALAQSIDFDGTDDYVTVANAATFDDVDCTITFLVNAADTGSGQTVFSVADTATNNDNVYIRLGEASSAFTDESITVAVKQAGTSYAVGVENNRSSILDSTWHHGVVVCGASSYTIYIDGVSQTITVGSGASNDGLWGPVTSVDDAAIGVITRNTKAAFCDGKLADVRYYNRALSSNEVETLYGSLISRGNPIANGLVGYWPCDDLAPGTGDLASATIVDRSGGGSNGTGSDADASGNQGADGILSGP